MKILHLIDELKVGGAQTHLGTMLAAAGRNFPTFVHRVIALGGDGPMRQRLALQDVPVHTMGLDTLIRRRRLDLAAREIHRAIVREKPDVVEAHLTFSRLLGLPAALVNGVPVRIGYEQGDVYLTSLPFRAANLAFQFAAQRIVVCSATLGEWARATHRIQKERLWVLHNCVDVSSFTPRSEHERRPRWHFGDPTVVFACVGSLGTGVDKRVDVCIRATAHAISRGADVALVVAGDGKKRDELQRLSHDLGLAARVLFLGVVHDVASLFRCTDAFCHAAPFEPFGIVCIEAMAAGLPALVPDSGGMQEAVTAGETGLIYRALDHESLGDAMVTAAADRPLRESMGRAGRRRAELHFSSDAYIQTLYAEYARLLAGASRRRKPL